MHDWGDRGRGRGYDSDGGTGGERNTGKQRTPDEETTGRIYRVWQEVESVATRVEQLSAIVRPDEWRTERDKLQQAHDTLVENVTARELDAKASAGAREHYTNATKKLGDIATTLTNAHEPRRTVPPVGGEEAIEPSIVARSAAPEEVLAWVSELGARDRRAIVSRLDAVKGGSVDRTDGFAVSLANYFGDFAVRKKFPEFRSKFLKTAEDPRHFDRAEYLKARTRANATTDARPGTPSTVPTDRAAIKLSAARPTAPTQGQESRGSSAGKQAAGTPAHALSAVSLDASPADLASEPDPDVSTRKGEPLPYRQEMERSFDRSFANIEAHTGMAAELEPLGAQAITVGHVVAFADAQPSPALVAHEATHAVQNEVAGTSRAMASGGVMSEHSPAEVEADAMADRVAQHGPGVRLPPVVQTPTGRIARAVGPRNAPPTAPHLYSASAWLDRMLVASPLRIDVISHLATAKLSTGHPRFTWTPASSLPVRVWSAVGNAARLQLVLAPFDILARIDHVRELGDAKGKANVGPLTYVPEVAPILARELEIAVDRCVMRLTPRLVAAFDATVASAGAAITRDASTVSPDALVFSHPLDRIVDDLIREGSLATIRPRKPDDAEPAPDRTGPGTLRAVTYRWAEDPALWNWIRVEPPDAKPEEVAKHVLGTTTRAYEVHGAAPYYALPTSHVQKVAPDRAAAFKVISTAHPAAQQADELNHGVSETALARSKVGETAGIAQAEQATDRPGAQRDGDAAALAERCRLQGYLIVDTYPELGAGSKLAAMAARLAGRTRRLSTMPAADYARFGKLFAQQSSVLYVVAGDLETIASQAKKLQHASGSKAIEPTLAGIADLVLDAAACSDLPETAHKQLELAHAKHAAIPFDAMDAMLDDARARTMATDSLAGDWGPGDSGSTKTSPRMTGCQQWKDLRAREKRLSMDVLTARRTHAAGTDKPGATRVLTERTRALQIEARLVAAETQCGYMGNKLEEQEGIVATIAGQMRDLQRARHGLQALANTMAGIRIRWREKHAQLFALVESDASANSDPATAIRHAIAELETELAQVGDEKTKAALETAQSELKDIAVARAVADIAIMIGLTLATSGVGAAAAGAARGLGMGRTAAQLVNVATQSVAMATLRTMLYHDSFSSAFGSELLTNFAGLAALRGVAIGLSKVKLGKSLAILRQGEGAWKYIAHGTELTIEAATLAGIQFAIAEADSIVRQGRTLNDDELKMLAIQGIGMFVGNAIAHRLANPALDALGAYAARIGAPYRRTQVRKLAERVARTGDPEASKELIRAERELVVEELALLQHIASDPAERAQFGEKTLATVAEQARGHAVAVTELGVEHALQHGLNEISPGKAWEGSTGQVEHVLAEARAQGATVHDEQLADGTRRHTVTTGAKQYTVYERSPTTQKPPPPSFTADEIAIQQAFLPTGGISGQAIRELARVPRLDPATLANLVARGPAAAEVVAQALLKVAHWPDAARTGLVKLAAHGSADAMRVYAKVLTSLEIDGMNTWVALASRELHNPDQILNLERSLDKGIEMHRLDPTTAMEVDYYKGKRITRAEREAERATPGFDKKQHTNIDLEDATVRREMKRVNPIITASEKFTGQIGEGVGKFRDAQQPSLKRGGSKKNIVDVDFGNRLQIPGADQAWIEDRVRRYIRANGDASQYVDTFIIHVELSGSNVDIIIEVP